MKRHEGLHADLTPVWSSAVAAGAEDLVRFSGRFLFGSDAPNNPVPANEQRRRLEGMGVPAEVMKGILGRTAEGLIAGP